jgi:hypothetical protein
VQDSWNKPAVDQAGDWGDITPHSVAAGKHRKHHCTRQDLHHFRPPHTAGESSFPRQKIRSEKLLASRDLKSRRSGPHVGFSKIFAKE